MSLVEKKQELSQGAMKEKPGETPPSKKEEKDTSLFRGKSSVSQEKGRLWAKREELYKITKIPPREMGEIWGKLTKGTDLLFERREAEKIYKEIKDFPTRSKEKYEIKSESERIRILEALKKSLGK